MHRGGGGGEWRGFAGGGGLGGVHGVIECGCTHAGGERLSESTMLKSVSGV